MKRYLILHTVTILIIVMSSCKNEKSDNATDNDNIQQMITKMDSMINESISIPEDTLDFLDFGDLMDCQRISKEIIPEIIKYALSSEIRIIRNELFARKGYIFKNDFLKAYFNLRTWYRPRFSTMDTTIFSADEKDFLDTLIIYESRNKDYTQESFKTMLFDLIKNSNHSLEIPISLWKQVTGSYPYPTNHEVAPWEFLENTYTLEFVDYVDNYIICLLDFYCGGGKCETSTIYTFDKNLNLIDETESEYIIFDIIKSGTNSYEFRTMIDVKEFAGLEEVQGEFKIMSSGEIVIKTSADDR